MVDSTSTFESVRQATGWIRPGTDHGCPPVAILPGLWIAHQNDIYSSEIFKAVAPANLCLVVNFDKSQSGNFGDSVEVLQVDLDDDPEAKQQFDQGKGSARSACSDPGFPLNKRCAGSARKDFDVVNAAITKALEGGGAVLVHSHASVSRAPVFILAYIMQSKKVSAVHAALEMQSKWKATWPCDRFVMQLVEYEMELFTALPPAPPTSTFEELRQVTGWRRPGADHGCLPVEIIPGLWTAHYHDIDTPEKLKSVAPGNVRLVVNTATSVCEARTGFFGDGVEVMLIDLEDDPDARKQFDQGKEVTSACSDKSVPLAKRFPGDAKKDFACVNDAINATIASGGVALVHCHASLSRSAAFIIAYLMQSKAISAAEAAAEMKVKWDATWPCERFCMQLIEYEAELKRGS